MTTRHELSKLKDATADATADDKRKDIYDSLGKMMERFQVKESELADLIDAGQIVAVKREATLTRAAIHAELVKTAALPIKEQIAAKKAKDAADKERIERVAKESMERDRKVPDARAEMAGAREALEAKRIADEALEATKGLERKRFNRALHLKETEKAREKAAQRMEAQRASAVKAIFEQVERLASNADPIYAALESFHKKANPTEKKQMADMLDDASWRVRTLKNG